MTNPDKEHSVPDPCVIELRAMLQSVLDDNFVRLYHYGSRVEGRADSESDYDLLCVTKRELNRQERDDVLAGQLEIQMKHGVVFDLHFRCERQVDPASSVYTPYVDQVVSVGIVV